MNRVAIHEAGMLTQCYDSRSLHPVTPTDTVRGADLVAAVGAASPGQTVRASPRDVHMRWSTPQGVLTTLGEEIGRRYPLVVLACDPKGARP